MPAPRFRPAFRSPPAFGPYVAAHDPKSDPPWIPVGVVRDVTIDQLSHGGFDMHLDLLQHDLIGDGWWFDQQASCNGITLAIPVHPAVVVEGFVASMRAYGRPDERRQVNVEISGMEHRRVDNATAQVVAASLAIHLEDLAEKALAGRAERIIRAEVARGAEIRDDRQIADLVQVPVRDLVLDVTGQHPRVIRGDGVATIGTLPAEQPVRRQQATIYTPPPPGARRFDFEED